MMVYGHFNGAATFQPRKVRTAGNYEIYLDDTSMGPRLFSRGKALLLALGGKPNVGLQWGRDFSAAERRTASPANDSRLGDFNGAATFQPRKGLGSQVSKPEAFGIAISSGPDPG